MSRHKQVIIPESLKKKILAFYKNHSSIETRRKFEIGQSTLDKIIQEKGFNKCKFSNWGFDDGLSKQARTYNFKYYYSLMENFRDMVLKKEKENKVIMLTIEGMMECDIDELIDSQPVEGLLYDLNRDKLTILTYINDQKWVNDYACMLVIKRLRERLEKQSKKGDNIK